MGFIDAFVYAHNYHHHNVDNPGNFQDCVEERIRLMTAITPAYAHAYRAICLARRPLDILCRRFRPPSAKAKTQTFPTSVPPLGIKVTTTKDGPCSPMEELIPLMAKLQRAGAPLPAHPMEDFSSCLVWSITTEASPCFMQERDFIPTTRRNSPASLKHRPSSGLQDPSPAARTHF